MNDRECIYDLVNKVCDLSTKAVDKITELKQENNKLKQRVAELEKPKKKRKFRAMTNEEYCNKHKYCTNCPFNKCYSWCDECDNNSKPCQLPNGKYILTEVKNNGRK